MRTTDNKKKDVRIIEHLLWAWLVPGIISFDLCGKYNDCPSFVNEYTEVWIDETPCPKQLSWRVAEFGICI